MKINNTQIGITRRKALKIGGALAGSLIADNLAGSFVAKSTGKTSPPTWVNPYREIRGFNYQHSY